MQDKSMKDIVQRVNAVHKLRSDPYIDGSMKNSKNYQSCARLDIYLHLKYLHLWHRVKDYMRSRK